MGAGMRGMGTMVICSMGMRGVRGMGMTGMGTMGRGAPEVAAAVVAFEDPH